MASPANLLDLKSPQRVSVENICSDLEFRSSPFNGFNTSFKDIERPSLAPLDFNSSDMLARESLGILPNTALFRESLTTDFSNISVKELLKSPEFSPRESLGVLNLSLLDLGRESIGLFNIQNSFLRRKSVGDTVKENVSFNLEDFNFNDIENGLVKKSPRQTKHPIPELTLSTSTTQDKINSFSLSDLNNAFFLTHSRILSAVSSGSSCVSFNPYFNYRSLEEPSKISASSSNKDVEMSQSVLATTDPFNEAFQIPTGNDNLHSVSQILMSAQAKNLLVSDNLDNLRNRTQSLPVALEDKHILADLDMETKGSNPSFQDAIICRAIEDEKEFDDSVFVEARKVASIIADTSFDADEKSSDSTHNMLDATPQPDWPAELDSSQSNAEGSAKSPKLNRENILKQVDKMLGMQPVNLEEKLKLKNGSNTDNTSLENISENISKISRTSPGNNTENQSCASDNFSQNISKISRTSQEGNAACQSCTSNNFSQSLSKITQTSEENASRMIQNLSDIVNDMEGLSQTKKKECHQMLHCLANMLCDSKSKSRSSCEDSGHSSVGDHHLEENKRTKDRNSELEVFEEAKTNDSEVCQALDLSCKGKSCGEINKRLSVSKSLSSVGFSSPHLDKMLNRRISLPNTSSTSAASNTSDTNRNTNKANYSAASNCSNASAKSGNLSSASRHSNISQNRVSLGAGKLKKSKLGVVSTKKGPLRAILPVENMAKETKSLTKGAEGPVTPERKKSDLKFGLRSKKTSTPIQEPKLKPMAASTPANRQPKDSKEHAVSPLAKPKYNRSFSYQPRTSGVLEQSENTKTRHGTSSVTKPVDTKPRPKLENTKLVRRNSVAEGTLSPRKDSEGPMRIKRSFSTGKETKIASALSRVRQNILNSPYYKPRKSTGEFLTENEQKIGTDLKKCGQELKRLSMISQSRQLGKENVKP